jgi:hypothetical protein
MRGHWRITLWTAARRVFPKGVSRETPPGVRRNWKKTGSPRGEVRSTGFWRRKLEHDGTDEKYSSNRLT